MPIVYFVVLEASLQLTCISVTVPVTGEINGLKYGLSLTVVLPVEPLFVLPQGGKHETRCNCLLDGNDDACVSVRTA